MQIQVRGSGLAARAVVLLLARSGFSVSWVADERDSEGPPLVLNDVSLALLRTILGRELSAGMPLNGRLVSWGSGSLRRVRSSARALSTGELHAQFASLLADLSVERCALAQKLAPASVDIYAGPPPPASRSNSSGQRRLLSCVVAGREWDAEYLVEAVPAGWLMAFPTGANEGVLQGVLVDRSVHGEEALDLLLRQSGVIAPRVCRLGAVEEFAAATRVRPPFAADDWIAIGSSAGILDPLSGEGSAFALRSALLCAALLTAVRDGSVPRDAGWRHYRRRMHATLAAHLRSCAALFEEAFGTDVAWRSEIGQILELHADLLRTAAMIPPDDSELVLTDRGLRPRTPERRRLSPQPRTVDQNGAWHHFDR